MPWLPCKCFTEKTFNMDSLYYKLYTSFVEELRLMQIGYPLRSMQIKCMMDMLQCIDYAENAPATREELSKILWMYA